MASNLFEKNKTKSQSSKCSEMVSKGPCFLAKTTTWARWAILNYSLGTFFISSILSLWLAPVSTKISCMSGWNWNKRSHKKLNFFLSRKLFNLVLNLDCSTRKVISKFELQKKIVRWNDWLRSKTPLKGKKTSFLLFQALFSSNCFSKLSLILFIIATTSQVFEA